MCVMMECFFKVGNPLMNMKLGLPDAIAGIPKFLSSKESTVKSGWFSLSTARCVHHRLCATLVLGDCSSQDGNAHDAL